MKNVLGKCVYALLGLSMWVISYGADAKDSATSVEAVSRKQFQWNEHTRLSWEDFKGPVTTVQEESAAATCCSIGFRTNLAANGKPEVIVYNTFYTDKSWVKEDARIQSILDHEQGHFDLCEIYTRKLRERMALVDLMAPGAKQSMMSIYAEISKEYEDRQQAYELETTHGTILAEQRRWQEAIAKELM